MAHLRDRTLLLFLDNNEPVHAASGLRANDLHFNPNSRVHLHARATVVAGSSQGGDSRVTAETAVRLGRRHPASESVHLTCGLKSHPGPILPENGRTTQL